MKLPKPVTSCTKCGGSGYKITLANGKCARIVNWKRCKGTNQRATRDKDWAMCPSCEASGYAGAPQCSQCGGPGWFFVRERRL
jgi:DnaJ-class molecular chaperone